MKKCLNTDHLRYPWISMLIMIENNVAIVLLKRVLWPQYGQDLSQGEQDRIFTLSFKYWSDVSGLSFSQVFRPNEADIKIRSERCCQSIFL